VPKGREEFVATSIVDTYDRRPARSGWFNARGDGENRRLLAHFVAVVRMPTRFRFLLRATHCRPPAALWRVNVQRA